METSKIYTEKKLLNKKGFHTVAAVNVKMEFSYSRGIECDVVISDCSRTISLDFDSLNAKQLNNSIKKAQILREVFETIEKELLFYKEHRQDIERHRKKLYKQDIKYMKLVKQLTEYYNEKRKETGDLTKD